jgi:broad specificity phosphatase PhoE
VPLSPEGRDQARTVARHLAGTHFDAAYCGDLSRALETADLMVDEQAEHASRLVIDQDLREISDGIYEGWLVSDAAEKDPRLVQRMDNGGPAPDVVPPNGESVTQFYRRQQAVASVLKRHHQGHQVLVVGHGWAFRALAAALLGEGPEGFWKRESLQPASVSILECHQGSAAIVTWGDTTHLATAKF